MNLLDEYRHHARECQRMADIARNPTDKASWLRLAASWLGMLKNASRPSLHDPQQPFVDERKQRAAERSEEHPEDMTWPAPSDKDSQASH